MSDSFRRKTERHLLPSTTDGICALVRDIISSGRVQRLELDVDDAYVRVVRSVEDPDLKEDEVTWDGALRNVGDMPECDSERRPWSMVLVDMLRACHNLRKRPVAWVTGSLSVLEKWTEHAGSPVELLGVPVHLVGSLPEETLVLCCSTFVGAEPSEVDLAIKTVMEEISDAPNDQVIDRGWHHPKKRFDSDVVMALAPVSLRKVPWKGTGQPR